MVVARGLAQDKRRDGRVLLSGEEEVIGMDEEPCHVAILIRNSDSCGNESRRESEFRWDAQLAVQQPRGRRNQ